MRAALDFVYRAAGGLAAVFIVAIVAIVFAQVCLNLADKISVAMTGQGVGLTIPSYSDFTGFFLAGSSFLALAYALRRRSYPGEPPDQQDARSDGPPQRDRGYLPRPSDGWLCKLVHGAAGTGIPRIWRPQLWNGVCSALDSATAGGVWPHYSDDCAGR